MGLDASHDAWHGAYSAFSRWRDTLARAAGYEVCRLVEHEDLPGKYGRETVLIDWGHIVEKNYYGEWDHIPCSSSGPDPLLLLIAHSDCEGMLEPEHCALLADRLAELLPSIPEELDGGGHVGNVRTTTERFIVGCRAAAAAGERLDFH